MLSLLLMLSASAELPLPVYPDCGVDQTGDACPSDFSTGWEYISWAPSWSESLRDAEKDMPSGMSLDVAFRYSTGRWDVPIAITDSGIYWGDLSTKILLNRAELPTPLNAAGEEVEDLDGNGIFNISDYAEDGRIDITAGRDRADDRLDPSDLIYTFSDGVDDDGNGYVDDIAGWDFFGMDNDPFASYQQGYASHGTGVMKTAAQEGGDGGGIGICPNCPILPLRTGDTFITDGDRVGLAYAYAADRGVRVIGSAIGALSHPEQAADAIEYADSRGITMVAAAGDENSYHHNFPSADDPILYVHTVRPDNSSNEDVTTFLNFNNCNNYGPRVDLVVGKSGCATDSTAITAGALGLLTSAGLDAGVDLTPDEVRSLLRGSVDDVWLSDADLAEARTYPSQEGFDAYYGYGRLNIGRAVQRVFEGKIPPQVRLVSPGWFSWKDPAGGLVAVEGTIAAPHSTGVDWVVEIGHGPAPESWTEVASGSGDADGTLAEIDVSGFGTTEFRDLGGETVELRFDRAHEPMVTVRVVATDADGNQTEERHGFWVQADSTLRPGFPLTLGGSLEPPPQLWDFDGDTDLEIVQVDASGVLHVLQHDGSELAGFPVETAPIAGIDAGWSQAEAYASGSVRTPTDGVVAAPGIGDVDGDGDVEIIVATLRGRVFAWHHDGSEVAGFPVSIEGREEAEMTKGFGYDNGISSAPSLGDIDGDGDDEIVLGGMDQRLYVWQGDGSLFAGYPIELCLTDDTCGQAGYRILGSPALGDVDNDGSLDAAIGTNEVPRGAAGLAYLVDLPTATIWPGWPQKRDGLINQTVLPVLGEGHPAAIAMADIDGDGTLELASNAMLGSADLIYEDGESALDIGYVQGDFGTNSNVDAGAFVGMATNPAFGDLNADGLPDFVVGGATVDYLVSLPSFHRFDYQHAVGAWDSATGDAFIGFPKQVDDVSFLVAPSIADVSGDGTPDVLYGSGGYFLYAWDHTGRLADGWPKFTGGWILGAPAVGDIDGDGFLDVVVGTREGALFAWTTQGRADQDVQWAAVHHDARNTGNWHSALPEQAGPPDADQQGGCGCKGGGDETGLAALLLLPLLLRRRRQA